MFRRLIEVVQGSVVDEHQARLGVELAGVAGSVWLAARRGDAVDLAETDARLGGVGGALDEVQPGNGAGLCGTCAGTGGGSSFSVLLHKDLLIGARQVKGGCALDDKVVVADVVELGSGEALNLVHGQVDDEIGRLEHQWLKHACQVGQVVQVGFGTQLDGHGTDAGTRVVLRAAAQEDILQWSIGCRELRAS